VPRAAIWWARADLRLEDNPALTAALATGLPVQAVFVLEPGLWNPARTGPHRAGFLAGALRDLQARLGALGGGLQVEWGSPAAVLGRIAAEFEGPTVFTQAAHAPHGVRRESEVQRVLHLVRVPSAAVAPPGVIAREDGAPFASFTPFWRRWAARLDHLPGPLPFPVPGRFLAGNAVALDALMRQPADTLFPATSVEAHRRLSAFTEGTGALVGKYARERERLDGMGGALLSPYVRFGLLSGAALIRAGIGARDGKLGTAPREGVEAWLRENAWREHTAAQLAAWGNLLRSTHEGAFDHVRWRDDALGLRAWQEGRTGYPAVDAAMRQLAATGWLSNRARMLAASFLTKHLLVDWQEGARHFHFLLVDAEPAANTLGWQHVAGTGPGAQPWFRILNPLTQATRFDPAGSWVHRWVPEAGTSLACAPLIGHREARERAIGTFRAVSKRKGLEAFAPTEK
jgi:deoxyribodipyrimidine photo-lyase